MKTIWKFPLKVQDEQVIVLPLGAVPLSIQVQHGNPQMWALVDPAQRMTYGLRVYTRGTGHEITVDIAQCAFLGTYQINEGNLVFHVFHAGLQ